MLVLSRSQSDKVVFPTLGITVDILRVEGNRVRLGIDAPREIPVLRHELVDAQAPAQRASTAPNRDRLNHHIRNRLQKATLGLRMLQRLLECGRPDDAELTIFDLFNELKALERELSSEDVDCRPTETTGKQNSALIVEDDPNESGLLAGYLRLSGFEVHTANDGLLAMAHLAKNEHPNVVLLDLNMPRFDGRKTVSAIRNHSDYQDLTIFAVTGTLPEDASIEIGPKGVNRWFTKPVDPLHLVDAIHDEIGHSLLAI